MIIVHLIFVFSRFRRPASIALLCQPLHSSPVRSHIPGIESCCPALPAMLLFREIVLAPRPLDRHPSANPCLRVGFFFASLPLVTLTIFAASDLDELNTSQRYLTALAIDCAPQICTLFSSKLWEPPYKFSHRAHDCIPFLASDQSSRN